MYVCVFTLPISVFFTPVRVRVHVRVSVCVRVRIQPILAAEMFANSFGKRRHLTHTAFYIPLSFSVYLPLFLSPSLSLSLSIHLAPNYCSFLVRSQFYYCFYTLYKCRKGIFFVFS